MLSSPRRPCGPLPLLLLLLVLVLLSSAIAPGYAFFVVPHHSSSTSTTRSTTRSTKPAPALNAAAEGGSGSGGGNEHWREIVARLSGTAPNTKMPSSSSTGHGTNTKHRPRVLLGSGAFHLDVQRTRLLAAAMREHFGDTDETPRLLFVPYAAADGDYDAYVKRTIELGLDGGYALDSIHLHPDPIKAVREAKGIYIGGGNAFRLLQQLRAHKLLDPIRERVLQAPHTPFLGVSAGAVVACPTIRTSNDMPVCDPGGLDALGLVDFQLSAHFFAGDTYVKQPGTGELEVLFGGNREGKIQEYLSNNDLPVVGLAEGYILKCAGPRVELIGGPSLRGGALKIFRRGHAPLEWEGMGQEDLGPLIRGEGHTPVPLAALFGNPHKTQARVSPDGRWVSYLAPSKEGKGGVMNVWVVERHKGVDGEGARMVTNDKKRGIREHFWAENSRDVVYLQDADGDENWHLYKVSVTDAEPTARDLTPFEGVRAQNVLTSKRKPDELLVGLNLRSRAVFDVYRLHLDTGACVLDTENPGDVISWHTDRDFAVRAALAADAKDGGRSLRVRDAAGGEWRTVQAWDFEETGGVVGWNAGGDGVYVLSSLGSDTTRLVELDAATGEERAALVSDPRCDVGSALVNDETLAVEAVEFNYEVREWRVLDSALSSDFAAIEAEVAKEGRREFSIVSRTHDDSIWVVAVASDTGPTSYFMYHRPTKALDLLFVDRPELLKYALSPMRPVVLPTSDGLNLVSYLTLPPTVPSTWRPGLDSLTLDLPLVLLVHGGPWARDSWGFNPLVQLLASRGYAVLQPNYRGSSGFGKRFINLGNGEWGVGAMQRDLTESVDWAVAWGVADRARVAIMGASYGGYATLAGLCFTPDVYRCGIDIVGPAHIKTLFASIPPYWAPLKRQLVRRVGDVENDPELNEQISPVYHAKHIKAPLLIGQGATDPRVKKAESDQMVQSLRNVGTEVTYVVYPDEGHGFARPANKLDFYAKCEAFLARHLGGLYVAPHDSELFEGASAMLE